MGFNRTSSAPPRRDARDGCSGGWWAADLGCGPSVIKELEIAEELTKDNTVMTLTMCVNYGGRAEIADAAREIARRAAAGELDPEKISEATFAKYLDEPDMPDVDLFPATVRRAADVELPDLAGGVRGTGVPGEAVSGLRPPRLWAACVEYAPAIVASGE